LVVDDDAAVLRATRRLLVRLGREVLTAASGEEALNVLSTAHATVGSVVLDLNMPGLDGWAVLGELRRLWPALWVVVASGYDVAQLQSEGRAVVPDGWVQKPFDAEELGRLLEPPRRS
jgi:CheY-like chemotaxis protein